MVRDLGLEAHQAAEAHLEQCDEALTNQAEWPESMGGPYCGCTTCVVREVLHAAFALLIEAKQGTERSSS